MPTPTLTITISPSSAPQDSAVFAITWDLEDYGSVTGGTLQAQLDGANVGLPTNFGINKTFSVALPNTTSVGSHAIVVQFSGDPSFGVSPATSNSVSITVTSGGGGGGGGSSTGPQALVRVVCSSAAGTVLTRTQIENGELPDRAYQVSSLTIDAAGGGYDGFSKGTLTGTVGGTATRQDLTLTVDGDGAVTAVSGYDSSTLWDAPPRVTLTRWDGSGSGANFLGY
jgi:hypothetical protein